MNFSSSIDSDKYYYSCIKADEYAIRKRCPENMKYVSAPENRCMVVKRRKRRDVKDTNAKKEEEKKKFFNTPAFIDQDTVSKDVVLGGLYNGKTGQYFISKSLWSADTIKNVSRTLNNKNSETKFGYGRIGTEKMDKMDIKASLQLSILGGLIKVKGSAKFFRETSVYENEEVVNMYYKGTTKTEVIPAHTQPEILAYCSDKTVTHVVTSVTYGLNAYFQYTTRKQETNKEETLKGDVTASFNKFVLSITGSAQIDLQERKKYLVENTNVVFRGDILLNVTPTSYEKAVTAYKMVTSLLPTKPEEAQIVSARLSPIGEFCKDVHRKVHEISQKVMKTVLAVFNDIEKLEIRIDTLLRRSITREFLALRNNLEKYSEGLLNYRREFTSKLSKTLPEIRGGDAKEDQLMWLYSNHTKTAFSKINSRNFIEARMREINALEALLSIVNAEADNVVKMDYIKANDVLIGLTADRHLTLNLNIMDPDVTERYLKKPVVDEVQPWYDNKVLNEKIRSLLKPFKEFAKSNKNKKGELAYLIQVNKKKASKNSEISLFESRKNSEFILPNRPEILTTESVSHDSVTFATGKVQENEWIKKYHINYWKVASNVKIVKTFYLSSKAFSIKELDPITLYRFTFQYYTDYGLSPESQAIDVVTRPSSPPTNIQLNRQWEDALTVEWDKPLTIGQINGKELNINYEADIKDAVHGKVIMSKRKIDGTIFTFSRLKAASKYRITVAAVYFPANAVKAIVSKATSKMFYTSPERPLLTAIGQSSLTSVQLSWNIPKTAADDKIEKYEISYVMMNAYGNETFLGKTEKKMYTNKLTTKIADLVQGTFYKFQVKAISVHGSSFYSNAVIEKTKFEQTPLDILKSDFEEKIKSLSAAVDGVKTNLDALHKKDEELGESIRAGDKKHWNNLRQIWRLQEEDKELASKFNSVELDIFNYLNSGRKVYSCEKGAQGTTQSRHSSEIHIGKMDLFACILECKKRRKNDSKINGFTYRDKSCYCHEELAIYYRRSYYTDIICYLQ